MRQGHCDPPPPLPEYSRGGGPEQSEADMLQAIMDILVNIRVTWGLLVRVFPMIKSLASYVGRAALWIGSFYPIIWAASSGLLGGLSSVVGDAQSSLTTFGDSLEEGFTKIETLSGFSLPDSNGSLWSFVAYLGNLEELATVTSFVIVFGASALLATYTYKLAMLTFRTMYKAISGSASTAASTAK